MPSALAAAVVFRNVRREMGISLGISSETINVGVYGCAVFKLRGGQDALIAFALKLIEACPVLRQALRTEKKTRDFAALLIENDARVASRCTPAFWKQRADDGRRFPLSRDICQDMFVRPARRKRSINKKSVDDRFGHELLDDNSRKALLSPLRCRVFK